MTATTHPTLTAQDESTTWSKHWPSNRALLVAGLVGGLLLALGVLFSIGLTLHEAYDAQAAMGEPVSPPPFNDFFEAIHGMLAGWMWRLPQGWMW
jgi:hypothetical protein